MSKKGTIHTSPSVFPNPQRVRLMMLEKGIAEEYEEYTLNMLGNGQQKSWKYNKINPWGETPALQLPDGTCMSEATGIARYLDNAHAGRKIMGESPLEQGLDQMWDQRIWVHLLYRMTVQFHLQLTLYSLRTSRLGGALELTSNPQWGEHCRKEALATAATLDKHLSDGRNWMLGGNEPTFSDITLCTAIAFGMYGPMEMDLTHRFEFLDKYWQRWQTRDSFKRGYADGGAISQLDYLKKQ